MCLHGPRQPKSQPSGPLGSVKSRSVIYHIGRRCAYTASQHMSVSPMGGRFGPCGPLHITSHQQRIGTGCPRLLIPTPVTRISELPVWVFAGCKEVYPKSYVILKKADNFSAMPFLPFPFCSSWICTGREADLFNRSSHPKLADRGIVAASATIVQKMAW